MCSQNAAGHKERQAKVDYSDVHKIILKAGDELRERHSIKCIDTFLSSLAVLRVQFDCYFSTEARPFAEKKCYALFKIMYNYFKEIQSKQFCLLDFDQRITKLKYIKQHSQIFVSRTCFQVSLAQAPPLKHETMLKKMRIGSGESFAMRGLYQSPNVRVNKSRDFDGQGM